MRHAMLGIFVLILLTGRVVADTVPAESTLGSSAEGVDGLHLASGAQAQPVAAGEEHHLGVLVIPLEAPAPAPGYVGDSVDDESYLSSLGMARVPLPAAAWLFGSAMVGMVAVSRRRPGKFFG